MCKLVDHEHGQPARTISHKHHVGLLLLAVASAALFYVNNADAGTITLVGNDKPVWKTNGITINGVTTNKLS